MIDETLTEMNKRWQVNNIFFSFSCFFQEIIGPTGRRSTIKEHTFGLLNGTQGLTISYSATSLNTLLRGVTFLIFM